MNEAQLLVNKFLAFYSQNKHKRELDQVTNFLLTHALSARGYNNYMDMEVSGEGFFIREILSRIRPQMCFDIGANVGAYSRRLLEETTSRVVAFEPMPQSFNSLVDNLSDFARRVDFENMGVGAENESKPFYFNINAASHASFSPEINNIDYVNNDEVINVPIITLDSYVHSKNIRSIDLLKIDVEGYESEVFKGATYVLQTIRPKFVQLEFNLHQLFRCATLNYFFEQLLGYEVYQLVPGGWMKRDAGDPLVNIFAYSNFIFSRID